MLSKVVVTLSPAVTDREGYKQLVCKRYPAVLDFLLLGFAPRNLKRHFATRLAHDEIQGPHEQAPSTDMPIISGSFMLFRTAALRSVGGFDERYFLYFEDVDLSLRVHAQDSLAYLPSMPLGGDSARKGAGGVATLEILGRLLRLANAQGLRSYSSGVVSSEKIQQELGYSPAGSLIDELPWILAHGKASGLK
jgi:hypothetical protein